ncbi:flagellar filament capping protein FliD [Sulfuricurvum sp.]|uniref:flagellar filament capping protein FliD n=1 Tax=Sulfuricurvum sp. TaxID=2025608 RepID=UPI0026341EC1|nr:flagellar filament capping protein FliD [Sulfuricurvum sp.]MDD2265660.1 flagellar filament capping protein FliD [Sulfuricurvum sp.]MDD2783609.1 flagellar filament capping protein FliD [Sulfuricurvum sp.]HZF70562.1 flagellar filament capping protein FliD [Sulfuricurvum sp.]
MSVSSLGAGAGVLTQTVIDQLKAADTKAIITPLDDKITLQKQKDSALSLLGSLLTTFQASANALDDDALYQKRTVSGATSSVSVTANAGVAIQSFSISNTVLAKKDVQESGSFADTTSTISSGSGTMKLTVNGTNYDIAYTSSTTLDDLKTAINNVAGDSVTASTLQVGTGDYRLILTSNATGANQAISITDSSGGTLNNQLLAYDASTNTNGMQTIQAASDASFKYNGITLTRSSNTVSDVVTGMTINLLQDSGSANISITQDTASISDAMSSFVTNYNSLTSQITNMTTTDTTAGKVGIFNGDSTIYGITRAINQIVTSVNSDGLSLPQFGIDMAQDGTMSFNSSTFISKFNENNALSEKFFSGLTTTDTSGNTTSVDGVFTSMNLLMKRYTASSGIMETLTTGSATDLKALNDNRTKSQALLDARYAAMAARFSQYDTIMNKLTNSFSSLLTQINAYSNGSN